jgi:hypothetical protein
MDGELDDLISYLAGNSSLAPAQARRVVADVVAYFSESAEAFINRRHQVLKDTGMKNAAIYAQIRAELAQRVVAAPSLSERQIRRVIYG